MLVHGLGRKATIEQIGDIVVSSYDGVPVLIRDLAENIQIGHEIRRGAVSAGGEGEVVLGLAFMLMGENGKAVTEDLKERLAAVQKSLPDDVILEVVDDRTVRVTLKQYSDNWLFHMSSGAAGIVSAKTAATNTSNPIGTGPFKFVAWNKGDSLTLTRNDRYQGTKAKLKDVAAYVFISTRPAEGVRNEVAINLG